MKNEYGVQLDRNGYAPSLFPEDKCYLCGKGGELVRHEIIHGSRRTKSKAYGLWVTLCPSCHWKIHHEANTEEWMKGHAQHFAMMEYGWTKEDFRERFGKNYL